MRQLVLASMAFLILTGCNQGSAIDPAQHSGQEAFSSGASPSQKDQTDHSTGSTPSSFDLLMENEHYKRGNQYFKERKFFSPVGANATESFLAARRSFGSPQEGLEEALTEMEPYLIIAIEKAQSDRDRQEATRLLNLLKIVNPKAPAIVRLEQQMYALGGVVALNPSLPSPAVADQDMANTSAILVNETSPQDQAPAQDIP